MSIETRLNPLRKDVFMDFHLIRNKLNYKIFILCCFTLLTMNAHSTPNPITIDNISANGSGCPDGTYTITIAPDQQTFSVLFDRATVFSNNSDKLDSKVCELTITANVPAGWGINKHTLDYRGFSQVDPGSKAFHRNIYYLLNSRKKWVHYGSKLKKFDSDFNDNYIFTNIFNIHQPLEHLCKARKEIIKIQMQITARSNSKSISSAQLAVDSIDGIIEGTRVRSSCNKKI